MLAGNGHQVGDVLQFTGTTSGTGANGVVSTIDNLSAVEFTLLAGGSGYRVEDTVTVITSGVGTGATFSIDAISNTANITFASGKDWEIIQHELYSAKLIEDESQVDAGTLVKQSLNIVFQGNDKDIINNMLTLKNKPLVLKITYSDGNSRIIILCDPWKCQQERDSFWG